MSPHKNKIVHDYAGIDIYIVFEIITEDLRHFEKVENLENYLGDFLYCLYASQAQIQRFGFHFLVQRQEAAAGIVQRDRWNFIQRPQYNNHQHIGRSSVPKQAERHIFHYRRQISRVDRTSI